MAVEALEGLRVGEPARSGASARLDLDPGRELARRTSERRVRGADPKRVACRIREASKVGADRVPELVLGKT